MIDIRLTNDGSHTLFVPELNEHYHSTFGAVKESLHVFIDAGFRHLSVVKNDVNILELGFGTGLNALLTLLYGGEKNVHYTGVEVFPVDDKFTCKLNYPDFLKQEQAGSLFSKIHKAPWNSETVISEKFTIKKIHAKIQEVKLAKDHYDLVYFDAFAPEKQPELWTKEIFDNFFSVMTVGGILVTYSSKGLVKKNLRAAGFKISRLPGPPGKRHILRGTK